MKVALLPALVVPVATPGAYASDGTAAALKSSAAKIVPVLRSHIETLKKM
jgi:hypothetical protein